MIGRRLGAYEITAKLGEGGMGEVYRATDTKLKREVAVKVLPAAFVEDKERLARFEREAQLLAQLHHPNIASIFGMEESDGTKALVMELVEGPTLAERLEQGPLPFQETLSVSLQIAQALEEAHEKGIVHRDLKPQNVKASAEGRVKVLDFGLAKAMDPTAGATGSASQLAQSPTLTLGATQMGVILGTAAYMSPEQAKGVAVDKRADIWAFGVVLHEMLTGRRLFAGDSVPETLAGVLKSEIDFTELPDETPAAIRRLLRRCLERNPKNRLHDIADARLELEAARESPDGGSALAPTAATAPPAPRVGWIAGVVAAAALGALTAWLLKPEPPRKTWRLALAPPEGLSTARLSPQISPHGKALAFLADDKLWVQELGSLTPRAVPKSTGATALTWSPDGASLAFAAKSQLLRTLPNGDVAVVANLAEEISSGSGGIAWTADDRLVYSTGDSGLLTVPVAGGAPSILLATDPLLEEDFHLPVALGEGRGLAFLVHRSQGGIDTVDALVDGRRRTLFQEEGALLEGLAWSASGHLLIGKSGEAPGVWAIPVRLDDLSVTGAPILVNAGAGAPTISRDGTLVLTRGAAGGHHQLVLVDREGRNPVAIGEPMEHGDHATFSPDGRHVAICDHERKGQAIWIHDLDRGTRRRLWPDVSCGGISSSVGWSPDGARLLVSEQSSGTIRVRRADGSDEDSALTEGSQASFTPDGRYVVFTRDSAENGKDLWRLALDGGEAEPFLATAAGEELARVAPGGRFAAYVSDATSRREVYLRPFPAGSGSWQVSVAGGSQPRWSPDGKRLIFLQGETPMVVDVELAAVPVLSDPRPLFSVAALRLGADHGYDIAPDGEHLVTVALGADTTGGGDLTLIAPWPGDPGAQ